MTPRNIKSVVTSGIIGSVFLAVTMLIVFLMVGLTSAQAKPYLLAATCTLCVSSYASITMAKHTKDDRDKVLAILNIATTVLFAALFLFALLQ